MCSWRSALVAIAMAAASLAQAATPLPGIGRPATAAEITAWDIDVRPDFKGLPRGKGSVAQGQVVWEAQCASCHGVFGESNEVFAPIVGGTGAEDVRRGRAARLTDAAYPGRTTLMKLATVSTLWDYINRAMPWNAPKTLKTDEVYAVTAFVLHLGGVLPADFVLSEATMAEAQARLPNRDGMKTAHALWPGRGLGATGRPDVNATACMRNCAGEPVVASQLPEHARDAHGNLAEQNRLVGAMRGVDTRRVASATPAASPGADPVTALLTRHSCSACHANENKLVGPSWRDVAARHASRADAAAHLAGKIKAGGSGEYGPVPMPPQALPEAEALAIARWITDSTRK